MPDGFAILYQNRLNEASFLNLVQEFESRGIYLANPSTRRITALSEQGDQFTISKGWLISQIGAANNSISFQWWLDESVDLYSRFRFLNGAAVVEFGLDGLGEKVERVNSVLLTTFKKLVKKGIARGLVIDRWAASEDYDWDRFFVGRSRFQGECPDVLGVHSNEIDRIVTVREHLQTETFNGFVILSRIVR